MHWNQATVPRAHALKATPTAPVRSWPRHHRCPKSCCHLAVWAPPNRACPSATPPRHPVRSQRRAPTQAPSRCRRLQSRLPPLTPSPQVAAAPPFPSSTRARPIQAASHLLSSLDATPVRLVAASSARAPHPWSSPVASRHRLGRRSSRRCLRATRAPHKHLAASAPTHVGCHVSGSPVRWKRTTPGLAQAGHAALCRWALSSNQPDGLISFSNFWFSSKLCKVQNFLYDSFELRKLWNKFHLVDLNLLLGLKI
jgi:hypothetical protein